MRFGPQDNRYDPQGYRPEYPQEYPQDYRQEQPMQQPQQPQQPAGGSYYSPRSGYPAAGSYGAPAPVSYSTQETVRPEQDLPHSKKKPSHKVLKAIAVFAGIALLSYGSIACYKYATKDDDIRSFLDSSSASESSRSIQEDSAQSVQESSAQSAGSDADPNAMHANWINLAARTDAMSIPDIVDKVTPATVGVSSTFTYHGQTFSMWGFGQSQNYDQDVSASGTGIIMSENADGSYYIITNAHVIYDNDSRYQMGLAKEVQIVLNEDYYDGETQFNATIVGYDIPEDLAVLKITPNQKLTVAEFGDSDDLRVGELVIAIGNPLGFDLFGSVTTGIVSALNREITINDNTMKLIQTDTAINAGNSGGPLINSYGQVIGINSSKISSNYYDGSASVEGLCFAIPISHAKGVINDLINRGYVTGRPMIGITGKNITEEISAARGLPVGVYVKDVSAGSAADLAGIQAGDVIIAVNGKTITTYEELNEIKDQYKAGDQITLTVTRAGRDIDFTLTLQEKKPSIDD